MSHMDRFFLWVDRFSDGQLTAAVVLAVVATWASFGTLAWLVLR